MTSRGHRGLIVLVLCGFSCVVAAAGFTYAHRGEAVLLRWSRHEPMDPRPPWPLLLLNPWRNRQPEDLAHGLLEQLTRGDCPSSLRRLGIPGERTGQVCAYRLVDWHLADRDDKDGRIHLLYRVHHRSRSAEAFVWITVAEGRELQQGRIVDVDAMW